MKDTSLGDLISGVVGHHCHHAHSALVTETRSGSMWRDHPRVWTAGMGSLRATLEAADRIVLGGALGRTPVFLTPAHAVMASPGLTLPALLLLPVGELRNRSGHQEVLPQCCVERSLSSGAAVQAQDWCDQRGQEVEAPSRGEPARGWPPLGAGGTRSSSASSPAMPFWSCWFSLVVCPYWNLPVQVQSPPGSQRWPDAWRFSNTRKGSSTGKKGSAQSV